MDEEVRETHQARACLGGERGKFGCVRCLGVEQKRPVGCCKWGNVVEI